MNDLERLNYYLGGIHAVSKHLYPRLKTLGQNCAILDIGTGNATLLRTISRWGAAHNVNVASVGLDLMERHLFIAQHHTTGNDTIRFLQGDAAHLPFADNSFDYVVSSLLVHHFTCEQAARFLREAYRCARHGIIISDLVRGWLPYLGYKLIGPIFRLHPVTRQDGEISIMRGFTRPEFATIAVDAGLSAAKVHLHPLFRMTLVADK